MKAYLTQFYVPWPKIGIKLRNKLTHPVVIYLPIHKVVKQKKINTTLELVFSCIIEESSVVVTLLYHRKIYNSYHNCLEMYHSLDTQK